MENNKRIEPGVYIEMCFQLRDVSGKLINEKFESGHSFVGNFIKILYGTMMGNYGALDKSGTVLTLTDAGDVQRVGLTTLSDDYFLYAFRADGVTADDTYGIIVGTDDGSIYPKAITNYKLGAKILHGTTAGKLSYSNTSVVNPTHDGSTYSYSGISRSFSNSSGGAVIVKEVGVNTKMYWESTTQRYFLIARDILGSPITVPNGISLTVSYRIKAYC